MEKIYNVNEIIEYFGFGKFGFLLTMIFGYQWFIFGITLTLPTVLSQKLHYVWKLSSFETAIMSSTVFTGYVIGSVTFGWLSDKHGRKWFCVIGNIMSLYYSILAVFTENVFWFSVMRLFMGIGMGCVVNSPCYLVEYLGIYQRSKAIVAVTAMFSIGALYVSVVAYFVMEEFGWKMFSLCTTLPYLFMVSVCFWLPESIRYLHSTGQYDQLIKILQKIAKSNRKKMPRKLSLICNNEKHYSLPAKYLIKRYHLTTIIKSSFVSTAGMLSYYVFVFLTTEVFISWKGRSYHLLTNNDYILIAGITLADLPGPIILMLVADKVGRKLLLVAYFILIPIILTVLVIPFFASFMKIAVVLGRFVTSQALSMVWVFVSESFPVKTRATAIGIAQGVGKVSVMAAPFLIQWLMHISVFWVAFITNSLCVVGIIATISMPNDTRGEFIEE